MHDKLKYFIHSYLYLILIVVFTSAAYSQNDSIEQFTELDEIVIIAKNQNITPGCTTTIPTKRQKDLSGNGYELLSHISLLQISVNPSAESVSTLTGKPISLFINGVKAQNYEINNIQTSNVQKIEYFEFPTDPNYKGEKYVLNFILKNVSHGGYVKAGETLYFINSLMSESSLFIKNNYKKMSYDFYTKYSYHNSHHDYGNSYESFLLLDNNENPCCVTKEANTILGRNHGFELPLSFRATYVTNNISLSNWIGFTHSEKPVNYHIGSVIISYPHEEYKFYSSSTSCNNNIWWNADCNLLFGKGYKLNLSTTLSFGNFKNYYTYNTSQLSNTNITNNSSDNFGHGHFETNLQKNINENHTIGINCSYNFVNHDVKYTSTSDYRNNSFFDYLNFIFSYRYTLSSVFLTYVNAGTRWIKFGNDEMSKSGLYPEVNLLFSYNPTTSHQFNLHLNLTNQSAPPEFFNSNIQRISEFLYLTGNVDAKSVNSILGNIGYSWIQSNNFNLYAFAEFSANHNAPYFKYVHYNNGTAILQSPENNANQETIISGVKFNFKPTARLQLSPFITYVYDKLKGSSKHVINQFVFRFDANYYLDKFFIGGIFFLPTKKFKSLSSTVEHRPAIYILNAGFGHGPWNIKFSLNNIFRKIYTPLTNKIISPLYSSAFYESDKLCERSISLSVNYTLDFGKKTTHNNELAIPTYIPSAILK